MNIEQIPNIQQPDITPENFSENIVGQSRPKEKVVIPEDFESVVVDRPLTLKEINSLKAIYGDQVFFGELIVVGSKPVPNSVIHCDGNIRGEVLSSLKGVSIKDDYAESAKFPKSENKKSSWIDSIGF